MSARAFMLVLAIGLLGQACGEVVAQEAVPSPRGVGRSRDKSYDVEAGQLKSQDLPTKQQPGVRPPPPGTSTKAARSVRKQAEADALANDMASGYRSLCCPHKSLLNADNCSSYGPQMRMLRFLAIQGLSRDEIDACMVNGGPPDLTDEYRQWLQSSEHVSERELEFYFSMPPIRGKHFDGMGWNKGWSDEIHEAPRSTVLYVVLVCLGVALITGFVIAFRKLSRREIGGAALPAAYRDPQLSAASAVNDRIRRELADMEDDA